MGKVNEPLTDSNNSLLVKLELLPPSLRKPSLPLLLPPNKRRVLTSLSLVRTTSIPTSRERTSWSSSTPLGADTARRWSPNGRSYDGGAGLVVLLLGDPHLLEGRQGRQDG